MTGQRFVRLWFHVGLVGLDGTKMSKSLGNLVFVGDLCKEWDPAAVRLALLAHHYREDWDWRTDEDMPAAAARLALWRSTPDHDGDGDDGSAGLADVRAALDADLDTPGALRALDNEATAGGPSTPGRVSSASASDPTGRPRSVGGPGPQRWSSTLGGPRTESGPGRIGRQNRKGSTMPGVISVGLPDGSTRELTEGTTGIELAQSIGSRLAKAAVLVRVNGREVDLELPLPDGAQVAIVTADSDAGREVLRHSTATSWPRPSAGSGPGPSTPSGR